MSSPRALQTFGTVLWRRVGDTASNSGVTRQSIVCFRYPITHPISRSPLSRMASSMPLMRSEGYINGQWIAAKSGSTFEVINPSNGQVIGNMANMGVAETNDAIAAAYDAFKTWRRTTAKERCMIIQKWFQLMMENNKDIAALMTAENGKPLAESTGEVGYAASFLEWYAAEGRRVYGETIDIPTGNRRSIVMKEPIGVAGVIIPWNFPAAMLTRKVAPALAVGCTVVVKTPEDTPFTPTALVDLAERAGFPKGVINILSCHRENTADIGKLMCEDERIATVSFTGSTEVGRLLMKQCSGQVKRVSLELGGLAPFVVFDSADLTKLNKAVEFSKFRNAGQACISSQNFLIQEGVHDKVVELLKELTNAMKLGDGCAPGVTVGPLINMRGLQKVERLVEDAKSKGANVIVGGGRAPELGELFFQPTLLTGVTNEMDIVHQEVFGPVIAVQKFKTEEEAIQKANNSERGLAGYFFSQDISQCYRVMESLEMGLVGVNEGAISAAECPFGGYKQSGIGREGGKYGVDEFIQTKLCMIGL